MTEFLKDKNKKAAHDIIQTIINRPDYKGEGTPYISFWSEHEIRLDGNFSLLDLVQLVRIMEDFK
jgi:hypothetical protein